MDHETSIAPESQFTGSDAQGASFAPAKGLLAAAPLKPEAGLDADKNIVFSSLIHHDGDITGLVAYSIYKQNKLDWLTAFEAAKGRTPGDSEITAYIIGESTARRLATYRHLAEATIAGQGPDVEGAGSAKRRDKRPPGGSLRALLLAAYAIIAALLLAGVWVALHYTLTAR